MKKSLLPKSKAKTAYGLLSEIAKLALAEPKRLRMGMWLDRKAARTFADAPACGTVGCIAGWAVMLRGTRQQQREMENSVYCVLADAPATAVLGLDRGQAEELFNPNVDGSYGTLTHARNAVRRIRRFQKEHAAQLKAKKV
jgi:hypothetical protein